MNIVRSVSHARMPKVTPRVADFRVTPRVRPLFDRAIALGALLALAPLLLIVAAAIKLDSKGPVLFRQKRYVFDNEAIEVFKFRTMSIDMREAQGDTLDTRDARRFTPVGRFIRKARLDELPQLLNVLLGELPLVAPLAPSR